MIPDAYRLAALEDRKALLELRRQVLQLRKMERAGQSVYALQLQGECVDVAMARYKAAFEAFKQQSEIWHGEATESG